MRVSKAGRVFNVVSTAIICLIAVCLVIGALLFALNNSPGKSLFGYRYYTVLTGSMSPSYEVGDVVFVHIEKSDKIKEGDVITFNPSNDSEAYLTHRVTEKLENYKGAGVTCFRTKGDANNSQDSFLISEDKVIGKVVFGIPKLGYIIRFVQLRWYIIAAVIVMIFVFIFLMKRYFKRDDGDESPKPEAAEEAGEANGEKNS